jgi:hypothetical protein
MEHHSGNYSEEERIVREMYENGPDGTKSMSELHQLSGLMEVVGRYAEVECMAREVLSWMQGLEMLGKDSPQDLGCMRCLTRSIWKQGGYEEAVEWVERCRRTIEDMARGRFGMYQDDERKQLEDDLQALEKWREEHDGE